MATEQQQQHLTLSERRLRYRIAYPLSIWFGCGLSPIAPGTIGTLGALPLYFLVAPLGSFAVLALGLIITVAGIWSAGHVVRAKREHDPQIIVVDEVAGVMLTLAIAPTDWKGLIIGVVLFRLFDQTKPWPARWMERLPGGYGVVLDDVVAAVWSGALLVLAQAVHWI
jgi:phosphatidylglycerophosphatase A